jgi:hypothetical protein
LGELLAWASGAMAAGVEGSSWGVGAARALRLRVRRVAMAESFMVVVMVMTGSDSEDETIGACQCVASCWRKIVSTMPMEPFMCFLW